MNAPGRRFRCSVLAVALLLVPGAAAAHVKWFAEYSLGDAPAPLSAVLTPMLLGVTAAAVLAVGVLAVAERRLREARWYRSADEWLRERSGDALLVLRVATGATLLLSWQADAMLAPELAAEPWIGWWQFVIALLLLFRRTVPLAGAGLAALYILAVGRYGAFHLLDYLHYAGIAWYLMVARATSEPLRESRIPALYLTVGFALCWLALEKLVYPGWTRYILEQNPQLTLGFDLDFFRVGAALVEFTLGYLFIICLFERPIAALVTLVFVSTTLVFGKVEVIGHTPLHGALIVFLLEGPGRFYLPPIALHRRRPLRAAFASVNYVVLFALGLLAYEQAARSVHEARTAAAPAPAVQGLTPR